MTNMIGDRGNWNRIPDLSEQMNREAEKREREEVKSGKKKTEIKEPEIKETNSQSRIINADKYWRIEGVNYNGKTGIYELSKELIPLANQDSLAEISKTSRENNGFYAGDSRLHYAIFKAVKNADNRDVRDFLQENMRAHWIDTLTRIKYKKSNDEIIHNYKQKDEYSLDGRIVGPDRVIEKRDKKALEILLGTENIEEIKDVIQFINSTPAYIYRVNNIPENLDERVVRFDAVSDGFYFDCCRYPSVQYPAFGVREVLNA